MRTLVDILLFRRMIAPLLLQLLFWGGVGGAIYGSYLLYDRGHWAWPLALVFGVAITRVFFEVLLLGFRSYERLCEIRDAVRRA